MTHKLHVSPNEKFPYDEFIKATNGAAVTAFIKRAKRTGKPWHLFYNIPNSHRPYPNSDKKAIRVKPARVKLPAYLPDTPLVRRDWAEYLAGIEEADALTGEALKALETSGDAARTIVVFLGDHGPTFQHGKMTLYDLGLRTPLMIRVPGLNGGLRTEMDPQSLNGKVPAIELYDLKSDPDEMRNLATEVSRRPELTRLYAALRTWVDETSDPGIKPPANLPD